MTQIIIVRNNETVPHERCFCRVKLGASPLTFPKIQLRGYKHRFCPSAYESGNTQGPDIPANEQSSCIS